MEGGTDHMYKNENLFYILELSSYVQGVDNYDLYIKNLSFN